jgi:hypothetical protein
MCAGRVTHKFFAAMARKEELGGSMYCRSFLLDRVRFVQYTNALKLAKNKREYFIFLQEFIYNF